MPTESIQVLITYRARLLDWRNVRGLGELQVLTRASYVMLILVPLLAGLWPGVRLVINRYNQAVTDATVLLVAASEMLISQAERLDRGSSSADAILVQETAATRVKEILQNLNSKVELLISDYSLKTIEKTTLPSVWLLAFLASLFVFFAHMIYQAWAPDLIRQTRIQEFALDRRNQHAGSPSEGSLRRAVAHLTLIEARYGYSPVVEYNNPPSDEGVMRLGWELDVVEQDARAEYRFQAGRKPVAAWTSGILYYIGMSLVLYIVVDQTMSVMRVAGWIS